MYIIKQLWSASSCRFGAALWTDFGGFAVFAAICCLGQETTTTARNTGLSFRPGNISTHPHWPVGHMELDRLEACSGLRQRWKDGGGSCPAWATPCCSTSLRHHRRMSCGTLRYPAVLDRTVTASKSLWCGFYRQCCGCRSQSISLSDMKCNIC